MSNKMDVVEDVDYDSADEDNEYIWRRTTPAGHLPPPPTPTVSPRPLTPQDWQRELENAQNKSLPLLNFQPRVPMDYDNVDVSDPESQRIIQACIDKENHVTLEIQNLINNSIDPIKKQRYEKALYDMNDRIRKRCETFRKIDKHKFFGGTRCRKKRSSRKKKNCKLKTKKLKRRKSMTFRCYNKVRQSKTQDYQ